MEAPYDLPSGGRVRVVDTATAGQNLGVVLQRFRDGEAQPLFFGDEPRPEGVVISFEQWAEYQDLRADAELEERVERVARERLANSGPESYTSFEDAAREEGWDLDVDDADAGGGPRADGGP
jgi:hypothetical protein